MAQGIDLLPENLFHEPIDCILADHFRVLVVCRMLQRIAKTRNPADYTECAQGVLSFLERDLPQHIADVEEDIAPRLLQRCSIQGDSGQLLGRLAGDHDRDRQMSAELLPQLRQLAAGRAKRKSRKLANAIRTFVEAQCRHLAWEEDAVLRRARRFLSAEDLWEIGQSMAKRRGISLADD